MSKDKRPKIVKNFEVIELSILGLGIINSALQYDALTAISSPFFVMFVQTFTFFIMLWIILAITRQKSSFAKWLLVFSCAISVPIYIPLLSYALNNGLVGLIAIGQLVLTLVGLYYLFTPEFKMYLKPKKKITEILVNDKKKNKALSKPLFINKFGDVSSLRPLVILFVVLVVFSLFNYLQMQSDIKNKNFNTKYNSVKKILEVNENKRISECYENNPRHTWDNIDCSGKEQ